MKIQAFFYITVAFLLSTSFTKNVSQESVIISRYLIAKSGYQILTFDNGKITKTYSHKYPLQSTLFPGQAKKMVLEYNQLNEETLKKELDKLPELQPDVFPKVFYEFIIDGDTIRTKHFVPRMVPNQLKKIEKLLFDYTMNM